MKVYFYLFYLLRKRYLNKAFLNRLYLIITKPKKRKNIYYKQIFLISLLFIVYFPISAISTKTITELDSVKFRKAAPPVAAIFNGGVASGPVMTVNTGSVKAGDIVGYMGNSGFSTGCHLHFEIRTSSGEVNPLNYFDKGYFIHPVPGTLITQRYRFYHRATDFASRCGTPVRAAANGEIIERVTGYRNTYPFSYIYGNYVLIRHTNGMQTLYAHLL